MTNLTNENSLKLKRADLAIKLKEKIIKMKNMAFLLINMKRDHELIAILIHVKMPLYVV